MFTIFYLSYSIYIKMKKLNLYIVKWNILRTPLQHPQYKKLKALARNHSFTIWNFLRSGLPCFCLRNIFNQ